MTDFDLLITTLFHQYSNSQIDLFLTIIANVIYVVMLYFLLHFFRKKQNRTLYLFIAAGVIGIGITTGLKYLINRPRPFTTSEIDLFDKNSPAFPSRHSFLAGLGLYFLPKEFAKKFKKLYQVYFLLVIPLSLLISGVHFVTDIIAGMAIGYLLPYLLDRIFKK